MESLLQDLRYALRALLRTPSFTIVAALTLALGIGANTAIFSVLYGVLLRPLPYPDSDRLVGFAQLWRGARGDNAVTWAEYQFLAEHATAFSHLAVETEVGFNVFSGGEAVRVDGLRVSKDYFRVLGVAPAIGRDFTDEEDRSGGPDVAILSHDFWRNRFASDTGIVGRTITFDGAPYTVIGIMPPAFARQTGGPTYQPLTTADVWGNMGRIGRGIGNGENLRLIGRLKAGLAYAQADAALASVLTAWRETFKSRLTPDAQFAFVPLRQLVDGGLAGPVRLLFGAIALVLLIACANVANLVLGRATTRQREMAVRVAIGATRGRLVRQLLTESVLLAFLGGAAGLVLADWGLVALLRQLPVGMTHAQIHLDRWALLFTFGASLLVGLVFGLLPAWRAAHADVQGALKEAAGRTTSGSSDGWLRGALVIAEVALSLVLLVGAGLLIRTMANMLRTNPGFDPTHVVATEIWLTGSGYDSTVQIAGYYDRLRARLEATPGIRSAGVIEAGLPLLRRGGNMGVRVDGVPAQGQTEYRTATTGYFETLGIPVKLGRSFDAGDVTAGEPVAIVNEMFARQYLKGDPLSHTITVGGLNTPPRRIVGVVGDVRQLITQYGNPFYYLPSGQTPAGLTKGFSSWFPIHVVVRTAGDPAAMKPLVARVIRATDARVPMGRVRTMDEVLGGTLSFDRFVMMLLSVFAALAVALAGVGLYGVMSYLVAQRTHEIGVRMALGAKPREVLGLVMGRGMLLTGAGTLIGLAGALGLTRVLGSLLYGVRPTDPLTLGAVTALVLVVALVACLVPARRATRVDPLVALRSE